jgi:putative oxidoreductase
MTPTTVSSSGARFPTTGGLGDLISVTSRAFLVCIFLISGLGKVTAPTVTIVYIHSVGLPMPVASYAVAVLVELGGSLALLAGFQTRVIALGMAAYSVVTALMFHNHLGDPNQQVHFLKNIAIAGGLLQVALAGGGRFSVDALRRRAMPG